MLPLAIKDMVCTKLYNNRFIKAVLAGAANIIHQNSLMRKTDQ
jgi:hypothetical protein